MSKGGVLLRPVSVGDLHGSKDVEVMADTAERSALAAEYGLLDVRALRAKATIGSEAGGAVNVDGNVVADIVQACVVTLVPVEQHIDEPFAVRFVRPGSPELGRPGKLHGEVVVDPEAPDPPEVLTGQSIDLGAVVEEAFVLAIDPYPRAPGAVLPEEVSGKGAEPADSPFSVLVRLKRDER
jgi:uncharacterized metal-binding protein YceD (DUF177 family)